MAKILTTQAELDAIFARMERDYEALTKRQQAYAIKEIGRVRGELAELLADYAGDDGIIKRQRAARLLRDLDEIERSIRKHGTLALEKIIEDTSEWTTARVAGAIGIGVGNFDRINRQVVKYVTKRFGDDGLVLSDRIWGLSGEIRDDLATVLRSGIIKGDGINALVPRLREVYDNETWKIRRLARNESVTARRAATTYNARESDIIHWVQFHHGVKRSKSCVRLAGEDRYGKGTGVFKTTDTEIWMPHVNCTGYITYVLDERWL
ncbi:hypothetical protein [Sporosarcina sp. ITBMC105]